MTEPAVADASVLVAVLAESGQRATAATAALLGRSVQVPHLAFYEVMHVIRRHEARGLLRGADARAAVRDLARWPVTAWPLPPFAERVWTLRDNLTAYDAAYVALAEALDAPLVTFDGGIAHAAGPRCEVIVPA